MLEGNLSSLLPKCSRKEKQVWPKVDGRPVTEICEIENG
jgi:hypothetical protein